MPRNGQDTGDVNKKIEGLQGRLHPCSNELLGVCVEALQQALHLHEEKAIVAFAHTVLQDLHEASHKAELPEGKLISPPTMIRLLLNVDSSCPESSYRRIRLACMATQELTSGELRKKVPMQMLTDLLTALGAALQANAHISSNKKAVSELLWRFFTEPLLKTAAKRTDINVSNRCYRAVNILLEACEDCENLAFEEFDTLCCRAMLQLSVHDDVEISDLLSRVLPQGYTALSLDEMRGIIEPCQEIISDQQALRFMMLQYNQFKRCSALMPIAALLDNGKDATVAYSKGDCQGALPTISRALIWSRKLSHHLRETARHSSGLLLDGASGCLKLLEKILSIGKLKSKIRRERQAALRAERKIKETVHAPSQAERLIEAQKARQADEEMSEKASVQRRIERLEEALLQIGATAIKADRKQTEKTSAQRRVERLEEALAQERAKLRSGNMTSKQSVPEAVPTAGPTSPTATNPGKPSVATPSREHSSTQEGRPCSRPNESIPSGRETKPSTLKEEMRPQSQDSNRFQCKADNVSIKNNKEWSSHKAAAPQKVPCVDPFTSPLQAGMSTWGRQASDTGDSPASIPPQSDSDNEFSPLGAGVAAWSTPYDSPMDSAEELKMLVIVPGVVVGKYSIKDDPEFVRALAPTHVATFAESLLSAASLTSLQEGKTELTMREWDALDAALANFFQLVKDTRQRGGHLLVPPGQLEMLVVVCFLAWEEGRSDVDVVSIVQDIQQDLGVQCPHREVLNLIFAWRQTAMWARRKRTSCRTAHQSWAPRNSHGAAAC